MPIKIAESLKPFSHIPGMFYPLPGTSLLLRIFPTRVSVYHLKGKSPLLIRHIDIKSEGPWKRFTAMLDLERFFIEVFGEAASGFIRYRIVPTEDKEDVRLIFDKEEGGTLPKRQFEKLSLGSHKKQEWQGIERRCCLKEILPHWFLLGQGATKAASLSTNDTLFNRLKALIEEKKREEIEEAFLALFKSGFHGVFAPSLEEGQFLGYSVPVINADTPLALLSEGAALIRSLFFTSKGKEASLLPLLPPGFHCGRLLGVNWEGVGLLNIDWTKKEPFCVELTAAADAEITLSFPPRTASFRLWSKDKKEGVRLLAGEPFEVKAGNRYILDRFQK